MIIIINVRKRGFLLFSKIVCSFIIDQEPFGNDLNQRIKE